MDAELYIDFLYRGLFFEYSIHQAKHKGRIKVYNSNF